MSATTRTDPPPGHYVTQYALRPLAYLVAGLLFANGFLFRVPMSVLFGGLIGVTTALTTTHPRTVSTTVGISAAGFLWLTLLYV